MTNELTPKFSNEFVGVLSAAQQKEMIEKVEEHLKECLKIMLIDVDNDHNTKNTAHRIAKMWVTEKMRGRFTAAPKCTAFPNYKKVNQMLVIGPIHIKSMCSHHFVDFMGDCYIGVLSSDKGKLLGVSKYARLAEWVARRPQIQEEMTMQIADEIEKAMKPEGVAVWVNAQHFCCINRGVEQRGMRFLTHEVRGIFLDDPEKKQEFLTLVNQMESNK